MDAYLHHQQKCVEDDQSHDEILERSRHDYSPDFIFEALAIFRHVAFERLGLDGKVDARFLEK